MKEIATVTLNNEMDLMLAHRRSMKLAELSGLSLSAQTTFATAVSEVSRSAMDNGRNSCLILGIAGLEREEKYIVATLKNAGTFLDRSEGFEQAKKLVNKFRVLKSDKESAIELHCAIPSPHKIGSRQMDEWKQLFGQDRPVSPYEEIKRKNEQLQLLAFKLQESEAQYKTLTNALPLIIFSLNGNGHITYANEWLSEYTGLNQQSLNESKWKSVVHEDDYESFSLLLNEKIISTVDNIKLQCRLKNAAEGEWLWHLISISPVADEKGNTMYWIGFMADINGQKIYEETLRANQLLQESQIALKHNETNLQLTINELNRSNRELQEFAYVASHDLQEPVRKIIYYADYLIANNKKELEGKEEQFLGKIASAANRMRNLIKDLLSYSEVNQPANFELVDLNEAIKEILSEFDVSIQFKKGEVQVDNLPSIEGNKLLLLQLFRNLIANAIKYAKPDETLKITIGHKLVENDIVLFVKDNGIGFDNAYLDKIFILFQRLHSRTNYEGTGLGLAICRKIVEVHKGSLNAKGVPGQGATFIVQLPIKQIK